MNPDNHQIKKIKTGLLTQMIFPAVIFVFFMVTIFNSLFSSYSEGQLESVLKMPVSWIFIGVFGLIVLSMFFTIVKNYIRMNRLLPALNNLCITSGLTLTDDENVLKNKRYKPVMGLAGGKFQNKNILVYPGYDYTTGNRNSPNKMTIFETAIHPACPTFTLYKKTPLRGMFYPLLGFISYRDKFFISPRVQKGISKDQIVSEIGNYLRDDILYDFENLTGKNEISVYDGLFRIAHRGFIYNTDEYMPYLNMLSKIKSE